MLRLIIKIVYGLQLPQGYINMIKESKKLSFYPATKYFTPRSIDLTNAGDIWFCADDGKIYKYDARNDSFIGYKILTEKEISASVHLVNILDAGSYGLIISSDIAGLRQFEPNTGRVTVCSKKIIVGIIS